MINNVHSSVYWFTFLDAEVVRSSGEHRYEAREIAAEAQASCRRSQEFVQICKFLVLIFE